MMSGSHQECSGVFWNTLGGIWSDVRPISEIIDFHPGMTSRHTKLQLFSSNLRADAQCFKIAMLLLHGAKHSSLALHSRLPEGRKPGGLQDFSGTCDFREHIRHLMLDTSTWEARGRYQKVE